MPHGKPGNTHFWQGKKVLITGHTGFKGSWLVLYLQMLGADITGFALKPSTTSNLFTLVNASAGINHIIGDIRDFSALNAIFNQYQPEIVFHMAAQPLVRYSYQEPIETYATNVMGAVHLLEAVRQTTSVKAVINVTTDKCYENKEWCWAYRENDPLGGHDPYSNSKACAEMVTHAYRASYFQKASSPGLATVRAGNVIGGGDWSKDRLVPDIINACIENRKVIIRNPHATRPWQHVMEPLHAYLLLAEHLYASPTNFSQSWNFGPNQDDVKPVSWITEYILTSWGFPLNWEVLNTEHPPHEAHYLELDCSKAKSKLNWKPRWDLIKGLNETINWYKAYQAKKDMRAITLKHIETFVHHHLIALTGVTEI